LKELLITFINKADENKDIIMPGYTHLQKAQPIRASLYFLAYFEMFSRDRARFCDAIKRINVLPLGSAALAGTTYPIDRQYTAGLLQFPEVSANSIDSVSDRDFMLEFLSFASIAMVHFSRLSEEMILWSSAEFGFIGLPDAFSTGSSIMPQKKNPDVPELVRGKAGRVFGDLFALLTLMKSLPLAYNRDMQEDKPAVFDAVDTLKACIEIYTAMLPRLKINKEILYQATTTGFLNATDLADYLVTRGMTFRESHSCVGKAVGYASSQKKELHELTLEEMKSFSTLIAEDIFGILTPEMMINRRTSFGGTAQENVKAALQVARQRLLEAVCP